MSTLKPCPFCGAPAELERDSDHHGKWFNLGCSRHWGVEYENPCIGGRLWYTETETTEEQAIAIWNTRVTQEPSPLAQLQADYERLRRAIVGYGKNPDECGSPEGACASHMAYEALRDEVAANKVVPMSEFEELQAENAELRKDAERYRWLRERDLDTISMGGMFVGITPANVVINGEDLDKEIDAHMADNVYCSRFESIT